MARTAEGTGAERAGGDTGPVDGFAAAVELRATDAESFDTLARTPVPYQAVTRALTWAGQALGVRDSALTATELRTLNATAPPR